MEKMRTMNKNQVAGEVSPAPQETMTGGTPVLPTGGTPIVPTGGSRSQRARGHESRQLLHLRGRWAQRVQSEQSEPAGSGGEGKQSSLWEAGGQVRPLGIGRWIRTNVNANIRASPDAGSLDTELAKLHAALAVGADTVMDLSTGGDLDAIREGIRAACPVALGTVPIYQAAEEAEQRWDDMVRMTGDQMLEVIERHAASGVDFMTLHCGVTRETVAALRSQPRICGIVSRGGSLLAHWMDVHQAESPLYERFDDLLAILKKYGVAASLGDGLRPGATADASDAGQVAETRVLGELVLACREAGVAVFVEGPGHMPLNQIARRRTRYSGSSCVTTGRSMCWGPW